MLYALLLIVFLLLVCCDSVRIVRTMKSRFELERQEKLGDESAHQTLEREKRVNDLQSLQRACSGLLIVMTTLVAVAAFGGVLGIAVAIVLVLCRGLITRTDVLHDFIQPQYERIEPRLLEWTERAPFMFAILRMRTSEPAPDPELHSREQLLHFVAQSRGVLTAEQKSLVRHGLAFSDKRVTDVMTPRSSIDSVSSIELLGPLVLDDLHKTGHSRFPVIDGDLDHIIGVLHIRNLLVLHSGKDTFTAKQAMEPRVFYIKETQTLQHALAAFLKSHHHLFVVINKDRETVGLLSLEDVIETLFGRSILDEFDSHDDVRAVAQRDTHGYLA